MKKGEKKQEQVRKIVDFRSPFCMRFSTACFALPAAPARGRILKKSFFPRQGQYFQHVGHFRAARESSEIHEMPLEKKRQKAYEKQYAAEARKIVENAPFWEPKWLQKSTPEASGSALAASCARPPPQNALRSALRGLLALLCLRVLLACFACLLALLCFALLASLAWLACVAVYGGKFHK